MDIISMQMANKVLKKMNKEYGGMYETFVATHGQKTFTTTKEFEMTGHTLKVFVDGALAIEGQDYAKSDAKTVVFNEPMTAGNIVLFTTEVVGIPKYEVINPPYDDTELRNKIQEIITALDEDGDGSIIDTINEIKAQWQSADGDLQALIAEKVDQAVVDTVIAELDDAKSGKVTLKARLDEIIALIPAAYDDSGVKSDIADAEGRLDTVENEVSTLKTNMTGVQNSIGVNTSDIADLKTDIENIKIVLDADNDGSILDALSDLQAQWEASDGDLQTLISNKAEKSEVEALGTAIAGKAEASEVEAVKGKISALENKTLSDFTLIDNATGRKFSIAINDGVLSAQLAQTILEVTYSVPEFEAGVTQEFTVSTTPNDDAGVMVIAHFVIPEGASAEYLEQDGNWYPLVDVFGPVTGYPLMELTSLFRATFAAEGTYTVKVEFHRVDNGAVMGSVDIPFKVNPAQEV